jgi:hypothetical protein
MIKDFVDRFMQNKDALRTKFEADFPHEYKDIVKAVVEIITAKEYTAHDIDPERIHEIDDGDYQGTLVYVIGTKGYQPYNYYYVKVDYGSCSGCDTLQAIEAEHSCAADKKQSIDDLMTLALHIVQGIKKMGEEDQ